MMLRRLVHPIGLGIILIATILAIIVAIPRVRGAQTNPRHFQPLSPASVSATMGAVQTRMQTVVARVTPLSGIVTPPTLTAEAQPIQTCTFPPGMHTAPVATVDATNPDAGILQAAQAKNADHVYTSSQTIDLAPQMSTNGKEAIYVRHIDCTVINYLVPYDQTDAFIAKLPRNDAVILRTPAEPYVGVKPKTTSATPPMTKPSP